MQTCFLVSNKETQIAGYLEQRSILKVVAEHRSLTELSMERLNIVDVDKFVYINYPTNEGDISFRSDMNALRSLLSSAFFHIGEAVFIFVDNTNPLMEDFIYSAIRESTLTRDKVDVIHHTGSLMLPDVGTYLSGSASGQTTSSVYKDVYVREADSEERDRFMNVTSGIDAVLPVLTDMSALYAQRASVEAISTGRMVTEPYERPIAVKDFTREQVSALKTIDSFVIAGDKWAEPIKAVDYVVEYCSLIGRRCLIVNLDAFTKMETRFQSAKVLSIMDIKTSFTPDSPIAVLDARMDQLGYVIEFLHNIHGVELSIFYSGDTEFPILVELISQMSENVSSVFVSHHNQRAVQDYLAMGVHCTSLFLNFDRLNEDFKLSQYKEQLLGTVVAAYPTEDADVTEFYDFATGGGVLDE